MNNYDQVIRIKFCHYLKLSLHFVQKCTHFSHFTLRNYHTAFDLE